MNCRGVIAELSDFLNGELDAAGMAELKQHLDRCKKCRIVVDTTRKTIEIFSDTEPLPLPDDFRERLHKALRKHLERR